MSKGFYIMQKFFAKAAFLPDGWADDVVISVDDHGFINAVETNAKADDAQLPAQGILGRCILGSASMGWAQTSTSVQ